MVSWLPSRWATANTTVIANHWLGCTSYILPLSNLIIQKFWQSISQLYFYGRERVFFACGNIQRTCYPELYSNEKHSWKKYVEEILYACVHFDKQIFQQHLVSDTKLVWMVCPSHLYDNKFISLEEITYFLTVWFSNSELIHFCFLPNLEFDKVQWWVLFMILLFDWTFIILLFFLERVSDNAGGLSSETSYQNYCWIAWVTWIVKSSAIWFQL